MGLKYAELFWVRTGELLGAIAGLVDRVKEAGRLRADFVLDGLVLMLIANRGLRASSREAQVTASRRFAALAIQSFRSSPEGELVA